jgi:hypothetical protein
MIDKFHTFCNPNYTVSSGNYIKVVMEVGEVSCWNGFFSVILNKNNGKTQIGKMVYGNSNDNAVRRRNIFGVKPTQSKCFEFEDALNNADKEIGQTQLSYLKSNAKEFRKCFNELKRSFNDYQRVTHLPLEDCITIVNYIDKMVKHFNDIINDANASIIVPADNVIEDTNVIDNTRKMIKMAKIKNADGLSEFINGNFYPVVKTIGFNNALFAVVLNDMGELRSINASRVEIVDVYAEPPINKPETAL